MASISNEKEEEKKEWEEAQPGDFWDMDPDEHYRHAVRLFLKEHGDFDEEEEYIDIYD